MPSIGSTFEAEDALLISRRRRIVMRRALSILGDKDFVRPWMRRSNVWLGDSPVSLLETAEGFNAVNTYLSQVEYGVYV
jgi:uncharacterized protein (DUF2384 family)